MTHYSTEATQPIYRSKALCYETYKPYYHREALHINKSTEESAIREFFSHHQNVVLKPVSGSEGRGIQFIETRNPAIPVSLASLFADLAIGKEYLVEESICQSDDMAILNPSSINTVRFVVMKGIRSECSLSHLYALIRIGIDGSKVDNLSAGGICAAIDLNTGKLITDGFRINGETFSAHPDTNVQIKGFQIPEWQDLLTLVNNASLQLTEQRMIGWDLAHTPTGWVVVEANSLPSFHGYQVCNRRGIKPLLRSAGINV